MNLTTAVDNKAMLLLKPPSMRRGMAEAVVQMVRAAGLTIITSREMIQLSREEAEKLYRQHSHRDSYPWLTHQMSSGYTNAHLVGGEDAGRRLKALVGPTAPEKAREVAPMSIRAILTATDESFERSRNEFRAVDNVVHCTDLDGDGAVKVLEEIEIVFGPYAFAA